MSFRFTVRLVAGAACAMACASNADAQSTSQTCSLASYCALVTNTSSGPSLHGKGNSSYGVVGNSTSGGGVLGSSASGSFAYPGIEGESTKSGFDAAAAFGLAAYLNSSTTPAAYGVLGYGRLFGSLGQTLAPGSSSSSGIGVEGYDGSTTGGAYNVGVLGKSNNGVGVLAEANGTPNSSITVKNSIPVGVYAVAEGTQSTDAVGIEVESNSFPFEAVNTANSSSGPPTVVDLATPSYIVYGNAPGGNFYATTDGNVQASGTISSVGGFQTNARTASGVMRASYASAATSPAVEDTGDAALVAGRAVVQIDASLADVIDMRRGYHVFLTPNGDCNGLYVSEKTRYGFVVRELHGGRSTLSFDYRIVAKPIGQDGQRLAVVRPQARARHAGSFSRLRPTNVTEPLEPKAALLQKLGPAGYAKELSAFEQRHTTL